MATTTNRRRLVIDLTEQEYQALTQVAYSHGMILLAYVQYVLAREAEQQGTHLKARR